MIDGIYEFTYRPVAEKRPAAVVFGIIMAMSLVIVIASESAEKYKGVISLAAVILICAAIYIFVRFLASDYAYILIFDNNGLPNLIVTKTVGKSVTTLFTALITDIQDIKAESPEERKKHRTPSGTKKYNYTVSLIPGTVYRVYTSGKEGKSEILMEFNEAVRERLLEYSAIARAYEIDGE